MSLFNHFSQNTYKDWLTLASQCFYRFSTTILFHAVIFFVTCHISFAQVNWIREYSDHSFVSRDLLHAGIQTNTGQMYLAATTEETTNDKVAHLLKYSAELNLEYDVRLKGDPEHIPTGHIFLCHDSIRNAIYLVGSYQKNIEENLIGEQSVLIKFDSSGNQLWTKRVGPNYATATALAIDESGNCVVGLSVSHPRIDNFNRTWLIKIGTDSSTIWEQEIGTLFGISALGRISRIFCTPGDPNYRIFISDSERFLWLRVQPDSGFSSLMSIVSGADEVFESKTLHADRQQIVWAYSRKYQSSGNYQLEIQRIDLHNSEENWKVVLDTLGQDIIIQDLLVEPNRITAIGHIKKLSGKKSVFLFQVSSAGLFQNFQKMDFSKASDIPLHIIADKQNGYLIAGLSETKPFLTNFFCRFSSSLELIWVVKVANDEKRETEIIDLWLHPYDNFFITPGIDLLYERKEMPVYPFNYDLFLEQRNLVAGDSINKKIYSGNGNGNFITRWLRTDSDGNVYVAGFRNIGFVIFGQFFTRDIPDIFLIKHDRNGNLIWSTFYEPDYHDESILNPSFFDLDKKENPVFVFNETFGNNDTRIVSYDKSGQVKWAQKINLPNTLVPALVLSFGISPNNDYYIQLFDQGELALIMVRENGQIVWRKVIMSLYTTCDGFHTLHRTVFDPDGNIVISFGANSCADDMFIEKRNLSGDLIWRIRTKLGMIQVDEDGQIYYNNSSVLRKFQNQTGAEIWSNSILDCQYCNLIGIKYGNVYLVGYNILLRYNDKGELLKVTPIDFPFWQTLMKDDRIVVVSREFESLIFNMDGDLIGSLECNGCSIYQFFPAISSTVGGLPWNYSGCLDVYKDQLFVSGDINRGSLRSFGFSGSGSSHVYTVGFKLPSATTTSSQEPHKTFAMNIFPNPSSTGSFTISLPDNGMDIKEILISDYLGRRIIKLNPRETSSLNFLLPIPGLYFVQAKAKSGAQITNKIVFCSQ